MRIKQELTEQIEAILTELELSVPKVMVTATANPTHGDYATNVALVASKVAKKNPMELGETLKSHLVQLEMIEKVEVAKPGFINIWLKDEVLIDVISNGVRDPNEISPFGRNDMLASDIGKGRAVVVEYSSPNIAKPFTIGHLRSTIIGDAVANLLEAVGYSVHRDNHLGDWGTQFGKQIYAIKTWGDEVALETSKHPVKDLVALYVRFHEEAEKDPSLDDSARAWFKKLEDGDPEARELWQKCIEWSWKEFEKIYEVLGVSFTENEGRGFGEAYFEDKMTPVITELTEKKLLETGKEGAHIVSFPEESKLPPLMILKKDGATLYATRDLATDRFRREKYGEDVLIINEVGAEQSLYFQQLYKLEELLGWFTPGQRIHVKHGLYRFKEGKMSTRKGNVIWLEEVLREAENRAYGLAAGESKGKVGLERPIALHPDASIENGLATAETIRDIDSVEHELKKIAKDVGIGAIKWNDLKRSPEQDISFDWDDILNMQGNSGPYIQYTYARTQSVIRKSGVIARNEVTKQSQTETGLPRASDKPLAMTKEEREVLRLLAQFGDVVEEAAMRYAPNILCTYLFELAQTFNSFYQKCPILKEEGAVKHFRLSLTAGTGIVLQKGLNLLGIKAPEKM